MKRQKKQALSRTGLTVSPAESDYGIHVKNTDSNKMVTGELLKDLGHILPHHGDSAHCKRGAVVIATDLGGSLEK